MLSFRCTRRGGKQEQPVDSSYESSLVEPMTAKLPKVQYSGHPAPLTKGLSHTRRNHIGGRRRINQRTTIQSIPSPKEPNPVRSDNKNNDVDDLDNCPITQGESTVLVLAADSTPRPCARATTRSSSCSAQTRSRLRESHRRSTWSLRLSSWCALLLRRPSFSLARIGHGGITRPYASSSIICGGL